MFRRSSMLSIHVSPLSFDDSMTQKFDNNLAQNFDGNMAQTFYENVAQNFYPTKSWKCRFLSLCHRKDLHILTDNFVNGEHFVSNFFGTWIAHLWEVEKYSGVSRERPTIIAFVSVTTDTGNQLTDQWRRRDWTDKRVWRGWELSQEKNPTVSTSRTQLSASLEGFHNYCVLGAPTKRFTTSIQTAETIIKVERMTRSLTPGTRKLDLANFVNTRDSQVHDQKFRRSVFWKTNTLTNIWILIESSRVLFLDLVNSTELRTCAIFIYMR